jgi:hypothetical protein
MTLCYFSNYRCMVAWLIEGECGGLAALLVEALWVNTRDSRGRFFRRVAAELRRRCKLQMRYMP